MTWVKKDDNFPWDPKVLRLSDRAYRVHDTALCYCGKYLTDGLVPKTEVKGWAGTKYKAVVEELTTPIAPSEAPLWHPDEGDFRIHKYLEYNPSRSKVLSEREARAKAGAKGGAKRWAIEQARQESKQLDAPLPVDPYPVGDNEVTSLVVPGWSLTPDQHHLLETLPDTWREVGQWVAWATERYGAAAATDALRNCAAALDSDTAVANPVGFYRHHAEQEYKTRLEGSA